LVISLLAGLLAVADAVDSKVIGEPLVQLIHVLLFVRAFVFGYRSRALFGFSITGSKLFFFYHAYEAKPTIQIKA